MGQAKRRKAEIDRLKGGDHISITAVHEAGHAVARFLLAPAMGFDPADAVASIEIATRPDVQATTYGLMFSKDIETVVLAGRTGGTLDFVELRGTIAAACTAGRITAAALDQWATAKMIIFVAGPMAEAKATSRPVFDVFHSDECAGDRIAAAREARIAGWSEDKIEAAIDHAVAVIGREFSDPVIWNALLVLAHTLPRTGTVDGRQVWETFKGAVESPGQMIVELTTPKGAR